MKKIFSKLFSPVSPMHTEHPEKRQSTALSLQKQSAVVPPAELSQLASQDLQDSEIAPIAPITEPTIDQENPSMKAQDLRLLLQERNQKFRVLFKYKSSVVIKPQISVDHNIYKFNTNVQSSIFGALINYIKFDARSSLKDQKNADFNDKKGFTK